MGLNHEDKTISWCICQLIKDVKNLAETKSNQGWFLHVNWWKRMKTWSQSELYNQESRTYKRRFCQIWNKILILNIKLSVMEYFILIIYLFTVFTNWFFFYLFFFSCSFIWPPLIFLSVGAAVTKIKLLQIPSGWTTLFLIVTLMRILQPLF